MAETIMRIGAKRTLTGMVPLLLISCAPTATTQPVAGTAAAVPRPVPAAGLGTVIGQSAAALTAQFGSPALDVREGPARKLQFSGPACVLDAYLYSAQQGREPVVTHVDARLPDGRDIDRASCVAALLAAGQGR
jgi:hypothetical protein